MAYMDYMDLAVCCSRNAVKLNHFLTYFCATLYFIVITAKSPISDALQNKEKNMGLFHGIYIMLLDKSSTGFPVLWCGRFGCVGQNEVKLWYIATGVLEYGGTQVEAGLIHRFGAVSMGESPSANKTLIWDEDSSFMIKIPQLIRECDIMKCGLDWSDTTVIKQYIVYISDWFYINGLVQERSYSIANALELCLSCTNPSMCGWYWCKLSQCFLAITVKHCCKISPYFSK